MAALQGKIQYLPLDKLIASPVKIRDIQKDSEELTYLVNSMLTNGFLESDPAIVLYNSEAGTYKIIDGLQRSEAARVIGLKEIPCFVTHDLTEANEMRLQFAKNMCRVRTSPTDQANHIIKYCTLPENTGKTQEQIASELGVTQAHVSNVMNLKKLDTAVQEFVHDGQIPFAKACALAKYIPNGFQGEFVKMAQDADQTIVQFVNLMKEHRKEIMKHGKVAKEGVRAYKRLSEDELIRKLEVAENQLNNLTPDHSSYTVVGERVRVLQECLSVDPDTLAEMAMKKEQEKASKDANKLEKKMSKINEEAEKIRAQLKAQAAAKAAVA